MTISKLHEKKMSGIIEIRHEHYTIVLKNDLSLQVPVCSGTVLVTVLFITTLEWNKENDLS